MLSKLLPLSKQRKVPCNACSALGTLSVFAGSPGQGDSQLLAISRHRHNVDVEQQGPHAR